MEVNDQFQVPDVLRPKKERQYQMNRRLGGPQSRLDDSEKGKNLLPLLGFKP
jgi:hypothetical protein